MSPTKALTSADGFAARQRQPGEAEIDCHLAALLFAQTIRINAGERAHKRRLSMVNVAGSGDDVHALFHQPSIHVYTTVVRAFRTCERLLLTALAARRFDFGSHDKLGLIEQRIRTRQPFTTGVGVGG